MKYLTYTTKGKLFLEPLTDAELEIIQCVSELPDFTGIDFPSINAKIVDDELNEVTVISGTYASRGCNPSGRLEINLWNDYIFDCWKADKNLLKNAIESASWAGEIHDNINKLYDLLVKAGNIVIS